jgi:hypothetical protein
LGQGINLIKYYPRTKRDIKQRSAEKTNEDRELARKFEKDFFDEASFDFDYYWHMLSWI